LREEHRLRVLENRVLRRIFGSKTDEVTQQWKKLMICTSHPIVWGDKIEKNEIGGACSAFGGGDRCV
jgi:hypothetical protein